MASIAGTEHPLLYPFITDNSLEVVSKPHLRPNGCVAGLR